MPRLRWPLMYGPDDVFGWGFIDEGAYVAHLEEQAEAHRLACIAAEHEEAAPVDWTEAA